MSCPAKLRREVITIQNSRCSICGMKDWAFKDSLEIHRIIPNRHGGKYVKDNVMAVCDECHRKIEGLSLDEILSLNPYMLPPKGVYPNESE